MILILKCALKAPKSDVLKKISSHIRLKTRDIFECRLLSLEPDHDYEIDSLQKLYREHIVTQITYYGGLLLRLQTRDIFECWLLSVQPDHDYEIEKLCKGYI